MLLGFFSAYDITNNKPKLWKEYPGTEHGRILKRKVAGIDRKRKGRNGIPREAI